MKRILLVLACLTWLSLIQSVYADEWKPVMRTPEETVQKYFEESYDQFLSFEEPDLSDVLDMDSVQCRNKIEVFKEIQENWKKDIEVNDFPYILEELPYYLEFSDLRITENEADVDVLITNYDHEPFGKVKETEEGIWGYPHFLTFGHNHFHMIKKEGKWLIDSHTNFDYGYDFD